MNVADYVIKFLEKKQVDTIFSIQGGGSMYLNDAVAKSGVIKPVFMHHEQSCAMAAVGYSKVSHKPGVLIVTSGCAGTNTITGVLDAWQDSNPLFIISGQANSKETTYTHSNKNLRKLGVQEANLEPIVSSITKKFLFLKEDKIPQLNYLLEHLWYIATQGRPGPVWIDIPLDIQSKQVPFLLENVIGNFSRKINYLDKSIIYFQEALYQSKRPIIVAGNGIVTSDSIKEFQDFILEHKYPFVTTFGAVNQFPLIEKYNIGRLGIKGTRAGNFAVANADLVIGIGTSFSIPATGFQYKLFAREAKIFAVDVDYHEHQKDTIKIDGVVNCDLKYFLDGEFNFTKEIDLWSEQCFLWRNQWDPFDRPDINELNMYSFSKELSKVASTTSLNVISDAGSAYYVMAQTLKNAPLILPISQGEMGFAIPASVGVWEADKTRKPIVVTGDGSFQFNIQELATISGNNIPVALVVLNNDGYLSIRNTQNKFFEGRLSGTDNKSGVFFPDLKKIAEAYCIKYEKITDIEDLNDLEHILSVNRIRPVIIEVICPKDESIYPTSATQQMEDGSLKSQPLENMFPFLSKEDFENEMIIPILQ